MGRVYTRFQTKTAQKPYPMGGTYLYGLYKGVPPGIEEIHVIVIAFVYLKYKQNSSTNQINNAGNTLQTDSHEIVYPCLLEVQTKFIHQSNQ